VEILTPPASSVQAAASLLAAATTPTQVLTRAGFGAHGYQAPACSGWRLVDTCTGVEDDHDAGTIGAQVAGVPYAIQVVDECTTLGTRADALAARARALLAQVESAAIAHEFWTGALAAAAITDAPNGSQVEQDWQAVAHLASTAAVDLTPGGGPPPLLAGIGLLEDALGDALAGAPATLHMRRSTLAHAMAPTGWRGEGSLILTPTGHRVVADAGYPGTGPNGATPAVGTAWIYGSARPTVYRSAAEILGDPGREMNRATNRLTTVAEKYALTVLQCGVIAVRVTLEP
jgi:hypothetical protein